MAHALRTTTPDGTAVTVDGRDVAAWSGARGPIVPDDPAWGERAEAYVAAHPRRDSAGVGAAQRLALLRRLAAGPATREDLLAMLRTVGWVGATDLENRLRDLRAGDARAGAAAQGLAVEREDGRWRLTEPFPALAEADVRALGFAKSMVGSLHGPLAASASAALEHLLPGVVAGSDRQPPVAYRARAADYERFEAARVARRAVLVRYFSLNSGREWHYLLVPVEYVTVGATVKAVCVRVDEQGRRAEDFERQFAMDRLLEVEVRADQPVTRARQLRLQRAPLELEVSAALYEVLRQRDIFGLGEVQGVALGYEDAYRVEGAFPLALSWDVMEQLCAWSGQVQVRRPLWLVNAVLRRLRAGLRVMEAGAAFELVKPEVDRAFSSHRQAVTVDEPLPEPAAPRKIAPPRRRP